MKLLNICGLVVGGLLVVSGCADESNPGGPGGGGTGAAGGDGGMGGDGGTGGTATQMAEVSVELTNVEPLGAGFAYEGWLIVDGSALSTGQFNPVAGGAAQTFTFDATPEDAAIATAFVLTVEPDDNDVPAAAHILAGTIINDGTAVLTMDHPSALNVDLSPAAVSGSFILMTPSSAEPLDHNQGIWWLEPGAGATLTLPVLPAGWVYEGWVVGPAGPISTGRFTDGGAADMDGGGPDAGPMGTPAFPGQDFIIAPNDHNLTNFAAVITVEPEEDDDPGPFTIKPLSDHVIADVGPGVLQDMADVIPLPEGTVTITMP